MAGPRRPGEAQAAPSARSTRCWRGTAFAWRRSPCRRRDRAPAVAIGLRWRGRGRLVPQRLAGGADGRPTANAGRATPLAIHTRSLTPGRVVLERVVEGGADAPGVWLARGGLDAGTPTQRPAGKSGWSRPLARRAASLPDSDRGLASASRRPGGRGLAQPDALASCRASTARRGRLAPSGDPEAPAGPLGVGVHPWSRVAS